MSTSAAQSAAALFTHLADNAERRGIDPSRFRRAAVELRRESMRVVLAKVAGRLRKEGKK